MTLAIWELKRLRHGSNTKAGIDLLTDGMDNASRHNYRDLRETLKQQRQSLRLFVDHPPIVALTEVGQRCSFRVASISGGAVFSSSAKAEVASGLEMIAEDLRHQYTIGFKPTNLDGQRHKLKIKLEPNEIEDGFKTGKRRRVNINARTRQGSTLP